MRTIALATALTFLAACGPAGSKTVDPSTLVVVDENADQIAYGQITTGTPSLSPSVLPAKFEPVRTTSSCRTPRPSSAARIAYIYTYGGGNSVPVHHVNFNDTPEAAAERKRMLQELKKDRKSEPKSLVQSAVEKEAVGFAIGNAVEMSRQVDVLVTETDAPVFLYLMSYDSILWNIQRAPGVEIDGIVVNSYDAGVIANGVDAERTGFISFANSPNSKCYVSGQGRAIPASERVAAAKKMNPNIDLSSYKQQWEAEYRESRVFFHSDLPRLIGGRPDWVINDARGGKFQAALVGPPPAAPFEAQPVTRLQIPSTITPFWGTRKDAFKNFGLDDAV
jgi:hypothetical protein